MLPGSHCGNPIGHAPLNLHDNGDNIMALPKKAEVAQLEPSDNPKLLAALDAILATGAIAELTLTPAMSQEILVSRNRRNRAYKETKMEQYKADMKEGNWKHKNGDTIRFYEDRNLADGQHRLTAAMEAKMDLITAIQPGLPIDAIMTVDAGTARTMADALKLDHLDNAKEVVATSKLLIKWGLYHRPIGGKMPTNSQIMHFLDAHKDQVEQCIERVMTFHQRYDPIVGVAELAAVRYRAIQMGEDTDVVDAWLEGVLSGLSEKEGAANVGLNHQFIKAKATSKKADKMSMNLRIAYLVKGFNQFKEGQLGILKITKKDVDKENYPQFSSELAPAESTPAEV